MTHIYTTSVLEEIALEGRRGFEFGHPCARVISEGLMSMITLYIWGY